jgi:nucleoside-diphosphate-sugar epimerase
MIKSVLITGGAGFLGTYSIEKYLENGYAVTVIDNFSTSVIKRDDPLLKNVRLIDADILQTNISQMGKFDLLVHLASPVGPVGILKHSGLMAKYILDDVYWAIKFAQTNNCPLIFVSTSEIYGYRNSPVSLDEKEDKVLTGDYKVRNEYSMAKLLAEIVLSNTAKVSNLKYQIIRPFNISGARQLVNGGFVLPTFVTQALEGKDITLFYPGDQVRAFTHVKDIVDGIYLTSVTDKMNEIWNIGNKSNLTPIRDLANRVQFMTRTKSQIVLVDPKTIHGPLYEEAWDKIPNADKIKRELGWYPKHDINSIVRDVIEFYKK